jgi:hypothetical protein
MNYFPGYLLGPFKKNQKVAKILAAQGATLVLTTPVANQKDFKYFFYTLLSSRVYT